MAGENRPRLAVDKENHYAFVAGLSEKEHTTVTGFLQSLSRRSVKGLSSLRLFEPGREGESPWISCSVPYITILVYYYIYITILSPYILYTYQG